MQDVKLFRKHKRNLKGVRTVAEAEDFGFAYCFNAEPTNRFCRRHAKEEIVRERERILAECRRMLGEYEETLRREENRKRY